MKPKESLPKDVMSILLSRTTKYLLFAAAAIFLFLFLQNSIPLWSSDEGRFGEIAREMWLTKNFVIAHFNGVPFLDKPILAPLLTAVGYEFFGVSSFTTRLVPILAALLGIFYTFRFARRVFDESTAQYAALFLLTTVGFVLVGRFAVIDMLLTFLLSMALFWMFLAFYEQKSAGYLAAYCFMGLAFLTKGLIGIVLPSGIFFVFLLWTGNLKELLRMRIPWGILILAAIILPWFYLAVKTKSDFFQVFIIEQHVHRFATSSFGRKRPFWFFIPILFGLGAPWTFFLPAAVRDALSAPAKEQLKVKFLICWILGILIFFSLPKSKLPYYILPALVPLALLIASFFTRIFHRDQPLRSLWIGGVWKLLAIVSCAGALGLNVYLTFFAVKPEILVLRNYALAASLVLALGFVTAYFRQKTRGIKDGVLTLAVTVYGGLILTFCAMKLISPVQSSLPEANFIRSQIQIGDIVAVYASPDSFSDLPFHLQRRVVVAGSDWGTLKEQSQKLPPEERDAYFWERQEFYRRFSDRSKRIFCLLEEEEFQELIQRDGFKDFRILMQGHEKVLITNL